MQRPSPLTLRKPSVASASPEAIAAFVGDSDDPDVQTKTETPAPPPSLRAVPAAVPARATPLEKAPGATTTVAPSFQRASRAVVERRTRSARRRTTIYFDVDVATDLSGLLAERDQELSNVVNTVVRDWLAQERKR
jgi:hypothetical protein